jgi:hypothetical protein
MKKVSGHRLPMMSAILAGIVGISGSVTGAHAQGGGWPAVHTQANVSYTSEEWG